MIELPENFDSVFRYIVVVSQRAEQLPNRVRIVNPRQHRPHPTARASQHVDQRHPRQ